MKKILMYRWRAYNYLDIKKYFEFYGYEVDEFRYYLEDYDENPEFCQKLEELLRTKDYDFVFTVNYFAVVATVCHNLSVPYVSWACDNPLISMFHESVFYDTNIIFTFDALNCGEFRQRGVSNIEYLPLAVDAKRISHILAEATDLALYKNEISFVGGLYERNTYDVIEPEFDPYLRGYLDGIIQLQSQVLGENHIEYALTPDVLAMIEDSFKLKKSNGSFSTLQLIFSTTVLGFKIARQTRITALNSLAFTKDVSIYSNSDTDVLPKVKYKGSVDYWTEMPKVFNQSRINLNFTIPNIKSGIPLRVWDILGSGGFLLTTFSSELPYYFEEEKDIVTFKSLEELQDKVDYYLVRDAERKNIIKNAYEKICKYHSYENRIGDMLEYLKDKL